MIAEFTVREIRGMYYPKFTIIKNGKLKPHFASQHGDEIRLKEHQTKDAISFPDIRSATILALNVMATANKNLNPIL